MDQNTVGENAGRLAAAGYGDMWGYGEEKVAPELSGRELRRPAGKEIYLYTSMDFYDQWGCARGISPLIKLLNWTDSHYYPGFYYP